MSIDGAGGECSPLVDHFFRHEYGRLVAVLTRRFGWRHFDLIEDTVQAALVEALQRWRRGVPADPFAWLRRVAQNRILDAFRRQAIHERATKEVADAASAESPEGDWFSDTGIADSELCMMFACCHPWLAPEARLALTLKTLCGFSNAEIARGLLTTEENVKKRITRAKVEITERGICMDAPSSAELPVRIESVHRVLYLMFNEGYSSISAEVAVRVELCDEAARLTSLLAEALHVPASEALLALMLFHTARLPGRMDPNGALVLLQDQDRGCWNWDLIAQATRLLADSGRGPAISRYHLEAGIAMLHSHAPTFAQTDWPAIIRHYDLLLRLEPSPIYALNRAVAVAELSGPEAGLAALEAIADLDTLAGYHLLDATRGELHRRAGRLAKALECFTAAREKTHSPFERELLDRRRAQCEGPLNRFPAPCASPQRASRGAECGES